jgi:hypothetical protein
MNQTYAQRQMEYCLIADELHLSFGVDPEIQVGMVRAFGCPPNQIHSKLSKNAGGRL